MATLVLSAAGAALGGAVGGGVFGLSSAVIGRAVGATIGRVIDQKLLGGGSEAIETGKLDRVRLMGASEGSAIPQAYGRVRLPGNVIWTSRFKEDVTVTEQSGGKGAPKGPKTRSYSYSVSLAIALCEGEVARVGRIWADGRVIDQTVLNLRVYVGREDQLPDPLISAIEGAEAVPAYRGLAYVVIEDLELASFGNRVPQFTFEVIRHVKANAQDLPISVSDGVQGVALIPGSGEYALATSPIYQDGDGRALNANSASGRTDFLSALDALDGELPNCNAASLVVSWFGDDLRAGHCRVLPKIETGASNQSDLGSTPVYSGLEDQKGWLRPAGTRAKERHPWVVSGVDRTGAEAVAQIDGRPIYGGTPADASVVEAIDALTQAGKDVMFYPFILMEVLEGNALPDPWSTGVGQASLPWRGRITTEKAPGVLGSTDGTAAARSEVENFMGDAKLSDFAVVGRSVAYSGPAQWGYRRFILHYAHLCAAAGGVDAFCIGSEMRALLQIRDEIGAFPAVEAFATLLGEVRQVLGPDVKLGYAADWSEYFGYHPQDGSGDVFFHLDQLWAHPELDFIGIDNYMPVSDWRDGEDHLDREDAKSIYDLDYLKSRIEGGEGYDWYYRDPEERELQIRTPINDGVYEEPWVFRYKDLSGWWSNPHFNRIGGVKEAASTPWVPRSKPIWFTELGCAAIDKGPNQPNKFLDPKSSESAIPHFSNGQRDDYVQAQYLRAYFEYFADPANNPVSSSYDGPMVDMSRCFIWAWDTRPWPEFPNNSALWSDGGNYRSGHWLSGRSSLQPLSLAVANICERSGLSNYDVSELHGVLRGYQITGNDSARAALQPLMVTFGIEAIEDGGILKFRNRSEANSIELDPHMIVAESVEDGIAHSRAPSPETVGQVRVGYVEADGEFNARVAEARFPDDVAAEAVQTEYPLALLGSEAQATAERWLSEARVARETIRFEVPPSVWGIKAGDQIEIADEDETKKLFRVDRIEDKGALSLEAVRIERQIYVPSEGVADGPVSRPFAAPVPITSQFMDLPLLNSDVVPHAPYLATIARPWPGSVGVYSSPEDAGYTVNRVIERPSTLGTLASELHLAQPGRWSAGKGVRVNIAQGSLSSVSRAAVLNGANAAAIGDGSNGNWEVVQFESADLVGPEEYELNGFLRGQLGTDAIAPDIWPIGSRFVLLDASLSQLDLSLESRGLARHYQVGPATRPLGDPSFRHYVEAFDGIGLRPYAPVHLKARRTGTEYSLSWIRRSRIDADSWSSVEIPLGENIEQYRIRVFAGDILIREEEVSETAWIYPDALRLSDGLTDSFDIEIAQLSSAFGFGPGRRITINVA